MEDRNIHHDEMDFSQEEYDNDSRDADYIPDSSSDDSDISQSFIPVGFMSIPKEGAASGNTSVHQETERSSSPVIPEDDQHDSQIAGLSMSTGDNAKNKHFCVFCGNVQAKLKRHLLSKHKDEKSLIPLLNATKKTEAQELAKLRHAGDHAHNLKVIKEGKGDVVVKRRKRKTTSLGNFVPCPKCFGWFSKSDLWRHKCVNQQNDDAKPQKRHMVSNGRLLLPQDTDNELFNEIMASMRGDIISIVVRNDLAIKLLGMRETHKNGHDPDRHSMVRNRMREMGRLLLQLRKNKDREQDGLTDFIRPDRFKEVVNATKIVASYQTRDSHYGTPSLALKIGHSIVRICGLLKAKAIEENDSILKENVTNYEQLHELSWEQEISTHASRTLYEQKKNTANTIPLSEDIVTLSEYISNQMNIARKEMAIGHNKESNWDRLGELTLASIILFNRRRSGEASKMKVTDFTRGQSNDVHNSNVLKQLSDFEKHLCQKMSRIEIIGKRGRIVPVILTTAMKASLEQLIEERDAVGVSKENVYAFARRNCSSLGHIRGCDTIRKLVSEVDLKHPENMTSTSFRKHVATMTQLVNLQDNELDIVAQFLGHDVRTHREHYRLPTSTVQVAKVTKLLLAMEKGTDYESKIISAVEPATSKTADGEDDDDGDELLDDDDPISDDDVDTSKETLKDPTYSRAQFNSQKPNTSQRDMSRRRPWSEQEKDACEQRFNKFIATGSLPGKRDINMAQEIDCRLQQRTWVQIKNFIRNIIKKRM